MPRALDLPATLKSAEKIRLGMRLPRSSALHASLSRAAPPGIRIVRFGEAAAADKLGWAKTIAAAGDRPTVEAAQEQWAAEFATFDTEHHLDASTIVKGRQAIWQGCWLGVEVAATALETQEWLWDAFDI